MIDPAYHSRQGYTPPTKTNRPKVAFSRDVVPRPPPIPKPRGVFHGLAWRR